jgi:hypothetical protein
MKILIIFEKRAFLGFLVFDQKFLTTSKIKFYFNSKKLCLKIEKIALQ